MTTFYCWQSYAAGLATGLLCAAVGVGVYLVVKRWEGKRK